MYHMSAEKTTDRPLYFIAIPFLLDLFSWICWHTNLCIFSHVCSCNQIGKYLIQQEYLDGAAPAEVVGDVPVEEEYPCTAAPAKVVGDVPVEDDSQDAADDVVDDAVDEFIQPFQVFFGLLDYWH